MELDKVAVLVVLRNLHEYDDQLSDTYAGLDHGFARVAFSGPCYKYLTFCIDSFLNLARRNGSSLHKNENLQVCNWIHCEASQPPMLGAPSERRIAMTTETYLISSPTIALFLEDGRHVAHLVPEGAMISTKPFNGNRLMEVTWANKVVMMFTQDLRTRGKKID